MATKDNVQGVVLALFGASAGGHLAGLTAAATANGLTAVAGDLAASAGFILGKDLSTAAAFRDNMLTGLGISSTNSAYAAAAAWADGELAKAGANRGEIVASAVNFLAGLTDATSPFFAVASAYRTTVTAAVAWSEGAGATVFGVAALQAQQGTSSNVAGSTFTLTTSDDTPAMTAGSDTVNATTSTLSADDRIIDSSTTDQDQLNITATAQLANMDVTNVEAININWNSFATPTTDLTDVDGATVTITSAKTGFLGNANFDAVGNNSIVFGAGITGTATVDAIEDGSVTATVAETLNIGVGTAADGTITVNAGAAESVTVTGADDVVLTALEATTVNVDTAFDSALLTLGVDADVKIDGASDSTVTITSAADISLDIDTTFEVEELTLAGEGAIRLDFQDSSDLSGLTVVNGGVIALADDAGAAFDIDAVSHSSIVFEAAFGADSTITAATASVLVFEADAAGDELDIVLASTKDSSSDSITATFEVSQTGSIDFAVSATTDFETVNIVLDSDDEVTIAKIAASTGTVNVSANEDTDVVITSIAAGVVDASTMTTDLTLTQTAAAAMVVNLGEGTNTVVLKGTSHESSVIGQDGDDEVTFDTTTGVAAALMGAGDNTVTLDDITSGSGYVEAGAGDDTFTLSDVTSATIDANLGAGDNEITFDPGTLAGATINVVTGAGDDTLTISGGAITTVAADQIVFSLGEGTNTLDFSGATSAMDLTAGTFTVSGVDVIEFGGAATDVILDGNFLKGQSYTLKGDGTLTDRVEVDLDTAGVYDFSDLQIDGTIAKAFGGLNIDGHTGNDTITGTDGTDDINTGNGTNIVDGGLGIDLITLGTGADTVILGKRTAFMSTSFSGADTDNTNIDLVTGFDAGAEDKIQLSGAANAYGTGITLTENTIINVVNLVGGGTYHNFTELTAAAETEATGVASTSSVLYIYVIEQTDGTLEDATYLIINNGTAAIAATDSIIQLATLTGTLDASDFTIV